MKKIILLAITAILSSSLFAQKFQGNISLKDGINAGLFTIEDTYLGASVENEYLLSTSPAELNLMFRFHPIVDNKIGLFANFAIGGGDESTLYWNKLSGDNISLDEDELKSLFGKDTVSTDFDDGRTIEFAIGPDLCFTIVDRLFLNLGFGFHYVNLSLESDEFDLDAACMGALANMEFSIRLYKALTVNVGINGNIDKVTSVSIDGHKADLTDDSAAFGLSVYLGAGFVM